MVLHDDTSIRIQILAAKDDAGPAGRAAAAANDRIDDLAAVGRGQGAEALLVCPAPDGFVSDGIRLVVAARFGHELDDNAVFWKQRSLAREICQALGVEALVLDLDGQLDRFLKNIEPMLASPYRDELGRRDGAHPGT